MKDFNNHFQENLNFGNIKQINKYKFIQLNQMMIILQEEQLFINLNLIQKDNFIIIFVFNFI